MRRGWKGFITKSRAKVERIRSHLFQKTFVQFVYNVGQTIGRDYVGIMAAGISYYSFLSLFPLVIGIISILGFLLPSEYIYDVVFEFLSRTVPVSTDFLEATISATIELRGPLGIISIIGLLIGATAVLAAISLAINRTWGYKPRPIYIRKPQEFLMVLAVGLVVLILLGITLGLSYLDTLVYPGMTVVDYVLPKILSFVLTISTFLILYKFSPHTKFYWRDIWLGALIGAAMFQLAFFGFTIFLRLFADYELIYGSLASLVAFLAWVYISSYILIMGSEINSVYYWMFKKNSHRVPSENNPTLQ